MPFIQWSDSLSVKVREIDTQHQKLVTMINQLHDAMSAGKGKDVLLPIINGLVQYVVTHFATEERLMAQAGYGGLAAHKTEHESIKAKVADFKKRYEAGQTMIVVELSNFLGQWLIQHIKGTDMKYSSLLAGKAA